MTNEELVARIRAEIDRAGNMLKLYNQNSGMIYTIARRYAGLAELEDLTQEGYIGLCRAVDGYDPDGGTPFVLYAWKVIDRHIRRYICGERNLPDYLAALITQYKKLTNAFYLEYGRKPTRAEYCRYLDVTGKTLRSIEKGLLLEQIRSLESPIGEEEGLTLADTVADSEDVEGTVLDDMQQEQLAAALWEAVDRLPDDLQEVVKKRYRENMTLKQIGAGMGISHERVRQKENTAIRRLYRNSKLRSFVEIRSAALHGTGAARFNRTWTSATERVALELAEIGVDVSGLSTPIK